MKKFFISLLLISGVVLPCFSSADNFVQLSNYGTITINSDNIYSVSGDINSLSCLYGASSSFCNYLKFKFSNENDWYSLSNSSLGFCAIYVPVCFTGDNIFQFQRNNYSNTITVRYFKLPLSTSSSCEEQYTSLQCQTEYNLIPINSVNQDYCVNNNLCPSVECPDVPVFSGSISNVYINDILHLGAPIIKMNIPEEIDWDYAYTNSGTMMNIDIVGYNQDFELIEDWIATNNYKPTSDDFTNIFTSGFSNLGGLLVALLFVILVFYFVKKRF